MEARRAKTWRSQGLVYDSRPPAGASLKLQRRHRHRAAVMKTSGIPRVTRQLCSPAQDFLNPCGEFSPISDLAQVFVMKGVLCGVQLFNLRLVVHIQELL